MCNVYSSFVMMAAIRGLFINSPVICVFISEVRGRSCAFKLFISLDTSFAPTMKCHTMTKKNDIIYLKMVAVNRQVWINKLLQGAWGSSKRRGV